MLEEGWHSILGTPRQGISRSKVPNILTLTSTYLSELSYKQTHDMYKSHKAGICSELVAIYHLLWQQQITIINSSLRTILLNININMAPFNFFFVFKFQGICQCHSGWPNYILLLSQLYSPRPLSKYWRLQEKTSQRKTFCDAFCSEPKQAASLATCLQGSIFMLSHSGQ